MSMKAAITSTNTMLTTANFIAQHSIWCAILVYMALRMLTSCNLFEFYFILFSLLPSQQGRQQMIFTTTTQTTPRISMCEGKVCYACDAIITKLFLQLNRFSTKPFNSIHMFAIYVSSYRSTSTVRTWTWTLRRRRRRKRLRRRRGRRERIHFQHSTVGIAWF